MAIILFSMLRLLTAAQALHAKLAGMRRLQTVRHARATSPLAHATSTTVGAKWWQHAWGMLQVVHANLLAGLLQSDPWTRDLPLAVDGSEANRATSSHVRYSKVRPGRKVSGSG